MAYNLVPIELKRWLFPGTVTYWGIQDWKGRIGAIGPCKESMQRFADHLLSEHSNYRVSISHPAFPKEVSQTFNALNRHRAREMALDDLRNSPYTDAKIVRIAREW